MRGTALLMLVVLLSIAASAKKKPEKEKEPSAQELAAITARGKMLAEYDVAAWHATDVIQDLKPQPGSFRYYIARKIDAKWEVVFGRLTEMHDKFLVVYQAIQGTGPEFFTDKKYDPPIENTEFFYSAAKAYEAALRGLGPVNRPYNSYAVPSETGQLYVYLLPAQTTDGIYPLGADVRYTFTADGNTLLEKHPMHKSFLEFDPTDKSGGGRKIQSSWHTHVLSDRPEDSAVFFVLSRKPSIPEMSERWIRRFG